MTPFEVLGLLTGLVVLAIAFGCAWQWWQNQKLARIEAVKGLAALRLELGLAHNEVKKILRADA